jgi:hypothetical protein
MITGDVAVAAGVTTGAAIASGRDYERSGQGGLSGSPLACERELTPTLWRSASHRTPPPSWGLDDGIPFRCGEGGRITAPLAVSSARVRDQQCAARDQLHQPCQRVPVATPCLGALLGRTAGARSPQRGFAARHDRGVRPTDRASRRRHPASGARAGDPSSARGALLRRLSLAPAASTTPAPESTWVSSSHDPSAQRGTSAASPRHRPPNCFRLCHPAHCAGQLLAACLALSDVPERPQPSAPCYPIAAECRPARRGTTPICSWSPRCCLRHGGR